MSDEISCQIHSPCLGDIVDSCIGVVVPARQPMFPGLVGPIRQPYARVDFIPPGQGLWMLPQEWGVVSRNKTTALKVGRKRSETLSMISRWSILTADLKKQNHSHIPNLLYRSFSYAKNASRKVAKIIFLYTFLTFSRWVGLSTKYAKSQLAPRGDHVTDQLTDLRRSPRSADSPHVWTMRSVIWL